MTGRRLDPEEEIRAWLAHSTPDRAPASLRETLEETTSRPPGRAMPWPRSARISIRTAGRIAAAAAVLAIVAYGSYWYGTTRSSVPAASGASTPSPTTATMTGPSPTTTALPLNPLVEQLQDPNWHLVGGALPSAPTLFGAGEKTVFAFDAGGFIAFVPWAGAGAMRQSTRQALGAPSTAGPTAPASWMTRVFCSGDGISWTEAYPLPSDAATVTSVSGQGGRIVAVGWVGEASNATAMAWTTRNLSTEPWRAYPLPAAADYSGAFHVAAGPSGFLVTGYDGSASRFWLSQDGTAWTAPAITGLPADPPIDLLSGFTGGWLIEGFPDRAAVWVSSDGADWTQTYSGPLSSFGGEGHTLGPIFKAASGGFLSIGGVGIVSGGPSPTPWDIQLWTSDDEMTWTMGRRVATPGWISGYASIPGGFVAAGAQPAPGDAGVVSSGSLGAWTSPDGLTWQAIAGLPPDLAVEVLSVAGDGATVVITFVDASGDIQLLVGEGLASR